METDHMEYIINRANEKGYNWDELFEFIVDYEPGEIADNLLHLYFTLTEYYVSDTNTAGKDEKLHCALVDLRALYKAIRAIEDGKKGRIELSCTKS